MKKALRIVAAFVALAVLIWLAFGEMLSPERVATHEVARGEAIAAVYGSGTAEPVRVLTIRAPVSGVWTNVSVEEGALVGVEQMLGQIEVAGLARDLERAEIELAVAQEREVSVPGVRALRAESAAVDARIELTERELERVSALIGRGIEQERTRDRLRAELAELEAQRDALRARRRDAEQGVDLDTERQRVLVLQARDLLNRTYLRAPFDGLVLDRLVEPQEWVQQGTALMRLGDNSDFVVEAEIDESDVGRVEVGSEALVSFYALEDRTFEATVNEVATSANRERGTFDVTLALSEPMTGLRPGVSAEVNIITERIENALLVPNGAIDGASIWLLDGRRVRRVEPTWGVRGTTHTQALDTLEEGDEVVVRPPTGLEEGARVRRKRAR